MRMSVRVRPFELGSEDEDPSLILTGRSKELSAVGIITEPDVGDVETSDNVSIFRWNQFLLILLPQFFNPYSFPFIALFLPMLALNIIGMDRPMTAVAWLIKLPLFSLINAAPLLVIGAFMASTSDLNGIVSGTLRADAIATLTQFACLRFSICIKYAFLTRTTFLTRLRVWATSAERNDEQLVSSWFVITHETIIREVDIAVLQQSSHGPKDAVITLKARDLPRFLALLRYKNACFEITKALGFGAESGDMAVEGVVGGGGGEEEDRVGLATGVSASSAPSFSSSKPPLSPDTLLHIPVPIFVEAIELAVQTELFPKMARVDFFLQTLSIFSTFATTIIRYYYGIPPTGSTTLQFIVIVGQWVANFFIAGVVFKFMIIGAVDHHRRALTLELLGRFFSPDICNGRVTEPVISFRFFGQTRAFLAARAVLFSFGTLYHERLILVTSMQLVIYLILSIYCIITFFVTNVGDIGPLIAVYTLMIVIVLPAFFCVGLGLWEAAKANDEAHRHVSIVANARMRLRFAHYDETATDAVTATDLASTSDAATSSTMQCGINTASLSPRRSFLPPDAATSAVLSLLIDVERALKEQHESSPISILGMPATWNLAQTFFGFILSLVTLSTTLFFSRLTGTSSTDF